VGTLSRSLIFYLCLAGSTGSFVALPALYKLPLHGKQWQRANVTKEIKRNSDHEMFKERQSKDSSIILRAQWYAAIGAERCAVERSQDAGKNWKQVSLPASQNAQLYSFATSNNQEFFLYSDWIKEGNARIFALFLSRDAGENWQRIKSGARLTGVTSTGVDGGTIFVLEGTRVYRSSDFGNTWDEAPHIPMQRGDSISNYWTDAEGSLLVMIEPFSDV